MQQGRAYSPMLMISSSFSPAESFSLTRWPTRALSKARAMGEKHS
jgi:hypothetical protein